MVTRNIAATIAVGGAVASSLPSSIKRANAELERLRVVQKANAQESRVLRDRLRELTRAGQGESEGAAVVRARLEELGQEMGQNAERMTELGVASRQSAGGVQGLMGQLGGVRRVAGPAGLALGAVTGIVVGLASTLSKAGAESNQLLNSADLLNTTTDSLQYNTAYFRSFTQDANAARGAAESVAATLQSFARTRFGAGPSTDAFLAATRLRLDINDLVQGELDPTAFVQSVVSGIREADLDPVEAGLRLEQLGVDPAVQGAILQAVRDGDEEAVRNAENAYIQSRETLEANRNMGRNIDSIKEDIAELVRAVVSGLIPPIVAVARFFTGYRTPEEIQAENTARQQAVAVEATRRGTGIEAPDFAQVGVRNVSAREQRQTEGRVFDEAVYGRALSYQSEGDFVIPPDAVPRRYGGRVGAGETTLVGEEGPELARFPAGTKIFPNRDYLASSIRASSRAPVSDEERIGLELVIGHPAMRPHEDNTYIQSGDWLEGDRTEGDHYNRTEGDRITIQQTIYLTIQNPGQDVDIERALANAAAEIGTQRTVG